RAAIFLFPRLSVRRGPRRCRQRSRVESSMGDFDGLKPGRIRIWISEVYAQSHAIERAWIDAGALFEFIDFRVGLRELGRIAAHDTRHGFVEQALHIDDRD